MKRSYKRGFIGFFLFLMTILVLGGWAFWLEPASYSAKNIDIQLKKWPRACDGLKVIVLADLHIGSPFNGLDKLEKIVSTANAEYPDLILLVGDYVITGVLGGRLIAPEPIANQLGKLKAEMGVFAVLGNHDWWFDPNRVKKALQNVNIHLLEDASKWVGDHECKLWLVGISDYWEGAHDVGKALAGIPPQNTLLVITHNPDVFDAIPSDVSLIVAGHTHGGQVYLPFIGRLIIPSRFKDRFAIGHIFENDKHMYVSPGIGTSILPVRFLVPPEISVLHLLLEK